MATIRMTYIVQSCPKCNKKLLKVAAGSTLIGSPLLECKKCGGVYRTKLREEWYKYQGKNLLWLLPLIIAAIGLVVAFFMGEDILIGLIGAVFGVIVGLCFTIKDLIRMAASKKRMRNASYLQRLLHYGAISETEYERFMRDAV